MKMHLYPDGRKMRLRAGALDQQLLENRTVGRGSIIHTDQCRSAKRRKVALDEIGPGGTVWSTISRNIVSMLWQPKPTSYTQLELRFCEICMVEPVDTAESTAA